MAFRDMVALHPLCAVGDADGDADSESCLDNEILYLQRGHLYDVQIGFKIEVP